MSVSNVRRDCLPIEALKDTQQMFMSLKSPMNPEASVRSVETIYTQIQYENTDESLSECKKLQTEWIPTHSGKKSNTCNQYDYASSRAGVLRIHLKTHSGEKLNKCNMCD